MQTISKREVVLTDTEMRARDYFERMLDLGMNIPTAVAATRRTYWIFVSDEKFWTWLGQ